ncbi:unnamed protein product [Blepharisma stoltei]|uniref:protein-tyrosine sulfotransferase n=1 Tax=Blepharisma stoltei TaxID=1481888 RepID=A0AAU9J165_9CILI|nr:unnamed protein product [Blepharisma stoltei]
MDGSESFDESNDWIIDIYQERIDFDWLNYNPHAFFPLDYDYFFRTGKIKKITIEPQEPPAAWKPCFIIGCGRSGSTVLCKLLSAHPDICFLNEPRELWMQAYPNFDVWSSKSREREGKLRMSQNDADQIGSQKLNELFYTITNILNRKKLIEKTPENTFRLKWLDQLFPGCKFIMVKRNPIGTARSIARFQPEMWFGHDSYKWEQLSTLLARYKKNLALNEEFMTMTENSNFAKALIEWALSILSAEEFKMSLPKNEINERFMEIHLERLINNPQESMKEVLEFLDLGDCEEVYNISTQIVQKHLTHTYSMPCAHVHQYGTANEEHILAQAGASLRNLIFEHSLHK